ACPRSGSNDTGHYSRSHKVETNMKEGQNGTTGWLSSGQTGKIRTLLRKALSFFTDLEGRSMEMRTPAFCVVLLVVLSVAGAQAAGPAGAYGFINKVVLEPNVDNPERIQLWGTFSIAA